ncbi:hypothetical protein L195_g063617, partial [Trifolium pratense]
MFFWCGSLPARYSERVRQMLATANVFARCS